MTYCPSNYQRGDELNPYSPFYEGLSFGDDFETQEEAEDQIYDLCPALDGRTGLVFQYEDTGLWGIDVDAVDEALRDLAW